MIKCSYPCVFLVFIDSFSLKLSDSTVCHFVSDYLSRVIKSIVKVAQLCPILCDPVDYTVHGILQARILEWVAVSFSRGSSQPRDQIQVSHIAGGFFTRWATREAHKRHNFYKKSKKVLLISPIGPLKVLTIISFCFWSLSSAWF